MKLQNGNGWVDFFWMDGGMDGVFDVREGRACPCMGFVEGVYRHNQPEITSVAVKGRMY
jgi:hypothetical protein